jgi:ribosomal protein S18 acetylase RimI-like enzyme
MADDYINLRPIGRVDRAAIIELEDAVFGVDALTAKQLSAMLKPPSTFAKMAVAVESGKRLGYIVYGVSRRDIEIVRIAVLPTHRKTGIATQLVNDMLIHRPGNVRTVHITVGERDVEAQLFLKGLGFKCVAQIHNGTEYYFELGDTE